MEVAGPLGTPLGLAQRKRASPRGEAGTSGFLYVSDSDRRVPAGLGQESQGSSCLRKGTPLASRVAQGVSGPSSSCVWNPRVFADDARGWQCPVVLCLHPQGFLRRAVRASGPSQERTGESGAFGMWHHPRGSSRISSLDRPHPEVHREGREPLPDHARESTLLSRSGGERGLRGSGAGTVGVPLQGIRPVGELFGVA